jgi:hypothetical protein
LRSVGRARGTPKSKDLVFAFLLLRETSYNRDPMLERYFVYMAQSASRRAVYIGFTNILIMRVIEHRVGRYLEASPAGAAHGGLCITKSTETRRLQKTASDN